MLLPHITPMLYRKTHWCNHIILDIKQGWNYFMHPFIILRDPPKSEKSPITSLFCSALICIWDIWFAIQFRSFWCVNLSFMSNGYWMTGDLKKPLSTPFQPHSLSVPCTESSSWAWLNGRIGYSGHLIV